MENTRKALIIDDDVSSRVFIGRMLGKINFTYDEAENGFDGIQMLKKNSYDLVLLDLVMPQIDGEHVALLMQKLNNTTPVVVVSAYLNKTRILKLAQKGVKGFVTKPL